MSFDPEDRVVKLCVQGLALEERSREEAAKLYLTAWNESATDFDRFLAAYHLARVEPDRLAWLERSLEFAEKSEDPSAKTAIATLHAMLAAEYRGRGPADAGPFFHGTRADLRPGDLLTPGRPSNYQSDLVMNHVYFTAMLNGAALAAALAQGDGAERVYVVEPTGAFEDDPNVTDKKFPGNLTRSYRTAAPLRVTGEAAGWEKRSAEEIRRWRERLASLKGKIIN